MRLYVVQTGQTVWESQLRLDPAAGSPLTEAGLQHVKAFAEQLKDVGIRAVYSGSGEAETQTAEVLADHLGAKLRTDDNLGEINYGLWQGLTIDEIKHRQPKAYRKWTESPASVRPPEGETVQEVAERLRLTVRAVARKHKGSAALVVLRPVALGLMRCILGDHPLEELWEHVDPEFTWSSYDTKGKQL